LQNADQIKRFDVGAVLAPLGFRERAVATLGGEFVNPSLVGGLARRSAIRLATSGVKQRATGSSNLSGISLSRVSCISE